VTRAPSRPWSPLARPSAACFPTQHTFLYWFPHYYLFSILISSIPIQFLTLLPIGIQPLLVVFLQPFLHGSLTVPSGRAHHIFWYTISFFVAHQTGRYPHLFSLMYTLFPPQPQVYRARLLSLAPGVLPGPPIDCGFEPQPRSLHRLSLRILKR